MKDCVGVFGLSEKKGSNFCCKKENKGGRPPKYDTPEKLQEKIDQYFLKGVRVRKVLIGPPNNRTVEKIPVPTITGLVLYCGFCDRVSFYDLEKDAKFSYTIKKARTCIEREYEEQLHTGIPTGAIFALKNFGWRDKTELEHGMSEHLFEKFSHLSYAELLEKLKGILKGTGVLDSIELSPLKSREQ